MVGGDRTSLLALTAMKRYDNYTFTHMVNVSVLAMAQIVAFEPPLRQDLSGYPGNIGHRSLNLCTQIVSIADVYDALRSNRVYRQGLPSDRIKAIMTQKDSPAFNSRLLRRFINLMGMYPVGTLRLMNRRS